MQTYWEPFRRQGSECSTVEGFFLKLSHCLQLLEQNHVQVLTQIQYRAWEKHLQQVRVHLFTQICIPLS